MILEGWKARVVLAAAIITVANFLIVLPFMIMLAVIH